MKTKTDKEEEVTMMDVYKEFNEKIAESHKILQFKSRKVDATTHLIFQEYLEVVYPVSNGKESSFRDIDSYMKGELKVVVSQKDTRTD